MVDLLKFTDYVFAIATILMGSIISASAHVGNGILLRRLGVEFYIFPGKRNECTAR